MSWEPLKDKVSIVGVGNTDYNAMYRNLDPNRTEYELAIEALGIALNDAGLGPGDIDGLITTRIPQYTLLGDLAGLGHLRFANGLQTGGRQAGLALQYGAMAIAAGLARCVALVYGNNGRSVRVRYGGDEGGGVDSKYDAAYGMTSPGAYMAMMFRRHQALYHTSEEALFEVARLNRQAAAKNPVAVMKAPLDKDEYFGARYIAAPLHLFDYCLINDGAAAVILMKTEDAKATTRAPVKIHSSGTAAELADSYTSRDCFYRTGRMLAEQLFTGTNITHRDVNALMIYENFTPLNLFTLEGIGYCEQGQSSKWILEGNLSPRDTFGYNTSGGHLSESYMQGWGLQIEAVRQLRGEAGDRQIRNCDVAQYVCLTTLATSHLLTR